MRALVTLYLVKVIFEAMVKRDYEAAAIYFSYGSLLFVARVIGGSVSETILGMRRSIFLGGILMALGHFIVAAEHN